MFDFGGASANGGGWGSFRRPTMASPGLAAPEAVATDATDPIYNGGNSRRIYADNRSNLGFTDGGGFAGQVNEPTAYGQFQSRPGPSDSAYPNAPVLNRPNPMATVAANNTAATAIDPIMLTMAANNAAATAMPQFASPPPAPRPAQAPPVAEGGLGGLGGFNLAGQNDARLAAYYQGGNQNDAALEAVLRQNEAARQAANYQNAMAQLRGDGWNY